MKLHRYPVDTRRIICLDCGQTVTRQRNKSGSRHPPSRCVACQNRRAVELYDAFRANPPKEPLTARQIADLLGGNANYVSRLIQTGKLRGAKSGHARTPYIVQAADLIAFVKGPWNLARTIEEKREIRTHTCTVCGEERRLTSTKSREYPVCRACHLNRQKKFMDRFFVKRQPESKESA